MDYQATKQSAYEDTYNAVMQKLGMGYLPNIKGLRNEIRSIKGRMDLIEAHATFAQSIEEVDKAKEKLAVLGGQREAYKAILKYVNDRIRETEKQYK